MTVKEISAIKIILNEATPGRKNSLLTQKIALTAKKITWNA